MTTGALKRPKSPDEIWGLNDLATEDVPVPEWGMLLTVRALSGSERDKFVSSLTDADGNLVTDDETAKLVALSVVRDDGKRFFSDDDVKKLTRKSGAALRRLAAVSQRLSGLGRQEDKALEKNSGDSPSDASPSS